MDCAPTYFQANLHHWTASFAKLGPATSHYDRGACHATNLAGNALLAMNPTDSRACRGSRTQSRIFESLGSHRTTFGVLFDGAP
jgi:hypothetical protein